LPAQLRAAPHPEIDDRPEFDLAAAGVVLRRRFPDLPRHFLFEYYPWYANRPFRHWDQWDRRPPLDLASAYVPRLGAYDSRSLRVIEQHARWILETGVGAVNLSWWGPDSFSDRAVPRVMDVMRAHGIRVAFHLEPYRRDHIAHFVANVGYLLRRYGDRRGWDALLRLRDADGTERILFKVFRSILPETVVDCRGMTLPVRDYVPDATWRGQIEAARREYERSIGKITVLANSTNLPRARDAGFDGLAVHDNYFDPPRWARLAAASRRYGLLFSFSVNPGHDEIVRRTLPADGCYVAPAFEPSGQVLDWRDPAAREEARRLSERRVRESLEATLALQMHPRLENGTRGFLAVYINSFNEWHEGHQFEPMKDQRDLTPAERALGYHNPADGRYRLQRLEELLGAVVSPPRVVESGSDAGLRLRSCAEAP